MNEEMSERMESISLHSTVGFTSQVIISSGQELVLFNNQYVLSADFMKAQCSELVSI